MVHDCNPFAGDKCNTIRLSTSNTIPYYFAPVIGINTGNTGAVTAASCKGACGAASSPLDIVLVLDRTGSMTQADVDNMKNAALSILGFYDSSQQWVGLVALPYGQNVDKCNVQQSANTPPIPVRTTLNWQVVPLSSDFTRPDGTLNTSSAIVQKINCLVRSPTVLRSRSRDEPTNAGPHEPRRSVGCRSRDAGRTRPRRPFPTSSSSRPTARRTSRTRCSRATTSTPRPTPRRPPGRRSSRSRTASTVRP